MMIPLLLLSSLAGAAELVLHDGSSAQAAADRAARVLGVPSTDLRPMTLTKLFAETPLGVAGAGSVRPCRSQPTRWSDIGDVIDRAQGDINHGRFVESANRLDAAIEQMTCLSDPIDPVQSARVFFLRGVLHFQNGNNREAFLAFRQALLFRSDLSWDDGFAPRLGKDLFDSAQADLERQDSAWFSVIPGDAAGSILVDGKVLPQDTSRITVRAGAHLVQVGGSEKDAAWVDLKPGRETRVLAFAAVGDDDVSALADPDRRADMVQLLTAAIGPVTPVTAVVHRTVWRGISDSDEWTLLARATGRERASTALTWSGGAVLLGGTAWTVVTAVTARGLYNDCEQGSYAACATNEQPYADKAALLPIAGAVTLGGAALLGTGLLLDGHSGVGLAPTWLEGGPGLQFVFMGRAR